MKCYPVTAAEIGNAVVRECQYGCTIAVRSEVETTRGDKFPCLTYGHENCYHYVKHDGHVYGVPKDGDFEFCKEM